MTTTYATTDDVNNLFVFICAVLVFFMHTGFAMLEVGGVQEKNRQGILVKNVMLIASSALAWFSVGFLLSGGVSTDSDFLGQSDGSTTTAFLKDLDKTGTNYINWFFGFAFAATSATIVSGAVAERTHFHAYLAYSAVVTGIVYPIVAYWAWMPNGWLKNAGGDPKNPTTTDDGYLDFAGSGVVHMVGGCAGMVGAFLVGPRRFMDDGQGGYVERFPSPGVVNCPASSSRSSLPFSALGTLILWVGWFGFNPGSEFAIAGNTGSGATVGLALVNTILCPATAAFTYFILAFVSGKLDLSGILNSCLGGLVAITANCNYVEPWAAVVIGFISTFVYVSSSLLLKKLQIDDVIDAAPVHYFCGVWGVLATGLFVSDKLCGTHKPGLFYGSGELFKWQLVGIVTITLWTAAWTALVLGGMKLLGRLRLSEEEEKLGMSAYMSEYDIQPLTVSLAPSPRSSPKTGNTPTKPGLEVELDISKDVEVGVPVAAKTNE